MSPLDAAQAATPYKMTRAMETHLRLLQHCLKLLRLETLPALWTITQGLFAPDLSQNWMREHLRHINNDQCRRYVAALSGKLIDESELWLGREPQLARLLAAAREEDSRLLRDLKNALVRGVQVFEAFETETRQRGSSALIATCRTLVTVVREYYERLHARWRGICGAPPTDTARTSSHWPAANIRRLHHSEFWVLEEVPEEKIAVLHRTPLPAPSLAALASDNDALLLCLLEAHRNFGLVVDMRQAPLRNDRAFEEAMAKLRVEITSHFERSAVLLDSALGELQVSRLERDEGRNTFITRSVAAAYRFAAGRR